MSSRNVDPGKLGRASLVGAVVAAIAASACCLGPAVLAVIGISGVGLAAALEPYRPVLLAITGALLAVGFVLIYRRPRSAPDCACPASRAARSGRLMLWVATLLVVGFAAYPYLAGARARRTAAGPTAAVPGAVTTTFRVEGMSCRGCVTSVTDALAAVDGVIHADVDYERAVAAVTYDPTRTDPARLSAAIEGAGYSARVEPTP